MTEIATYLDWGARRVLVHGIGIYQRHISPRKGFRCASRALHGGNGCSQEIKQLFLERPFREAVKGARQQFALCHEANRTLQANRTLRDLRQSESARSVRITRFDNDPPPDEENNHSRRGNRSCLPNQAPDCCELSDCACHGAEFAECLAPHGADCGHGLPLIGADCSALDCAAIDCAALDCGALDCGACACSF